MLHPVTKVVVALLLVVQGLLSLGPRVVCIAGGSCWNEPDVVEEACCGNCEAETSADEQEPGPVGHQYCDGGACFCCVQLPDSNNDRTPPSAPTRADVNESAPTPVWVSAVLHDQVTPQVSRVRKVHPPWMADGAQARALKASRLLI
jgi:hypothetical protein